MPGRIVCVLIVHAAFLLGMGVTAVAIGLHAADLATIAAEVVR